MFRKAILGVSALLLVSSLLSFGSINLAYAQDYVDPEPILYDEPVLYDDDLIYETTELTDTDVEGFIAFLVAYFAVILCISLPIYIYYSYALMTIGKKVGEDGGWMAWVPIVNLYYMVKVANLEWWWFLLTLFVPFISIYIWMKIAERRGFESWVGLLTIVPFVQFFIPGYIAWAEGNGSNKDSEEMTLEEVKEKAEMSVDKAEEVATDVTDDVKDVAQNVAEEVKDVADDVKDKM